MKLQRRQGAPDVMTTERSSSYKLEHLPLDARIAAVAKDVRSRRDQYRGIEPHELAELLGIDTSRNPDGRWEFIRFQPRVPFKDIVRWGDGPEWMYRLRGRVEETRYSELEAEADAVRAGTKKFQGEFLTASEKQKIEQLFMEKALYDRGTYYLGFFTIEASDGTILKFQARIEGDGGCMDLKTPYDARDGLFINLDDGIWDI